jgi:hypothetical protein
MKLQIQKSIFHSLLETVGDVIPHHPQTNFKPHIIQANSAKESPIN